MEKRTDEFGMETVACRICGDDTTFIGTKLCNGCWEVDSRIDDIIARADPVYLRELSEKIQKRVG